MQKRSNILSDSKSKQDDTMKTRMEGTNNTPNHNHPILYDAKGNEVECVQRDTIQRIYQLNRETETLRLEDKEEAIKRDSKLKEAFLEVLDEVKLLRSDLEERKLINNFNEKDKERLQQLIDKTGEHSEDTEDEVKDYAIRLRSVETKSSILIWLVPILFTLILAIQAINMYWLFQHVMG